MEQIKEYEYVDLGLPSGLKWATMNVGAASETDYGYYFQWGDVEDKSNADCSWESYKYCKGTYNTLTKYNNNKGYGENPDNITALENEDDAATQIMGGDWRMPTKAEIQELLDNTDYEWIEDYNGSGVKGRKFTSKTNGNSIFFPASDRSPGASLYGPGCEGGVWSSSLNTACPFSASNLNFNLFDLYAGDVMRYHGFAVRGVMS